MSLSRNRSTAHMRTTISLEVDSPRASLAALDASAVAPHQGARSSFGTAVVERANLAPQTVDIWIDGGYQPAQTVAIADAPLRILFHRHDADHCTERVVFSSSPHVERRLAANGTTVVDLPAQPAGVVRFTCGMGRYYGEIALVKNRPTRVRGGRLLGTLAAGAVVVTLLAAAGIVQVELAAGAGVLVAAATGLAWTASRLRTHP